MCISESRTIETMSRPHQWVDRHHKSNYTQTELIKLING